MTATLVVRRWSVVAVGVLLFAVAAGYAASEGDPLLIGSAEAALPVVCGLALVAGGYHLRNATDRYEAADVALVAVGGVVGSLALTALVGWILVVQTLDGDPLVEPAYTLLNGAAIGTGVGTVLTVAYVRIRRERRIIERQNDRLARLADVLSHDLRNPLNVAQGYAELARDRGEADAEHLDHVLDALNRMDALVEDSLTLTRQSRDTVDAEPVDLVAVAEASWRTVETGESDLTVDATGSVRADGAKLRRAFENLFRNAVEHNDRPVAVSVGRLPDGFYVADDGVGFGEIDPDRLFDLGYTTGDHGTGLGLDIVRTLAARHGWTVEAVAGSDGGARFEFTSVEWSDE